MNELETRSLDFEIRAESKGHTFTGISVPFDDEIDLGWGIRESVAPGAVDDEGALVFWRHREPIGKITEARDTDAGREISGQISDTTQGNDAAALLRDGVITKLSLGFRPIEWTETKNDDGTRSIRHTKIRVEEVSLVPNPAYENTAITKVREKPEPERNTPTMPENELAELREIVDTLGRRIDVELPALQRAAEPVAPHLSYRSAGALLHAIAVGDEQAATEYTDMMSRASDPGLIGDSAYLDTWLGDLTRWIEDRSALLGLFGSAPLPADGMTLEYAKVTSDTMTVDEQKKELDKLGTGKITFGTDTVPVFTYGGAAEISKQAAQRAKVSYLDGVLRALGRAANKFRNARFSKFYTEQVTKAAEKNTVTLPESTWANWIDLITDAAAYFTDQGTAIDALVTDRSTFKALAKLNGPANPALNFAGSPADKIGTASLTGATANIGGVPVVCDPKQTTQHACFVNKNALRVYSSPTMSLTDQDIISLSQAYSLYGYAAYLPEAPELLLPVTFGTKAQA
jgi:HK97 family phage prohead protease